MTTRDIMVDLLHGIQARDYAALEGLFMPDVRFRASLPDEIIEVSTPADATACYRDWFDDATELHVLAWGRDRVGDVTTFHYRLRARGGERWFVIQQSGAFETAGDRVSSMRIACTGFQAEAPGS